MARVKKDCGDNHFFILITKSPISIAKREGLYKGDKKSGYFILRVCINCKKRKEEIYD